MTKVSILKGLKMFCSWKNVLSHLNHISVRIIIVYHQPDRAILFSSYMMIHCHHIFVWAGTCWCSSRAASFSFACKDLFLHWCVDTAGGECSDICSWRLRHASKCHITQQSQINA